MQPGFSVLPERLNGVVINFSSDDEAGYRALIFDRCVTKGRGRVDEIDVLGLLLTASEFFGRLDAGIGLPGVCNDEAKSPGVVGIRGRG